MAESVVALFSMETKRVRIRTGEITKNNITDDEASAMINYLGPYLRDKNIMKLGLNLLNILKLIIIINQKNI